MTLDNIRVYVGEDGDKPTVEFISQVQLRNSRIVSKYRVELFPLLNDHGIQLGKPYAEYLEDGIWELRARDDRHWYRLFYFFTDNQKAMLLNGVIKNERETPSSDLETAKELKNQYESRTS